MPPRRLRPHSTLLRRRPLRMRWVLLACRTCSWEGEREGESGRGRAEGGRERGREKEVRWRRQEDIQRPEDVRRKQGIRRRESMPRTHAPTHTYAHPPKTPPPKTHTHTHTQQRTCANTMACSDIDCDVNVIHALICAPPTPSLRGLHPASAPSIHLILPLHPCARTLNSPRGHDHNGTAGT